MTFLGDAFVENLRLRRSLTFWKLGAFAVFALFLVGGGCFFREGSLNAFSSPYIARVSLSGTIDQEMVRGSLLGSLEKNRKVNAIILHIDSGGGGAAASEALYNSVKRVSQFKPVVVVVDGMMASGAYMVAMAAQHIVAQNTSIVGSVGMILQSLNLYEVGKKIGVKVDIVRSGRLKAFPSVLEEFSEEARSALQHSVMLANDYFLSMVTEGRNITDPNVMAQIATGRVFLGREALDFALVDEIGDEINAVEWLKARGITGSVKDLGFISSRHITLDKVSSSSLFSKLAVIFDSISPSGLIAAFPAAFA